MNEENKKIRQAIEDYEYRNSGVCYSGGFVLVKNLQKKKKEYVCDIHLVWDFEDRREVYREVSFPKEIIDKRMELLGE